MAARGLFVRHGDYTVGLSDHEELVDTQDYSTSLKMTTTQGQFLYWTVKL
jgi:hypothetical protein